MDEDIETWDQAALIAEVKRLRGAIREHRDKIGSRTLLAPSSALGLLPEGTAGIPEVPDWPQFLRGCIKYRESLDRQLPEAPVR